MQFCRNPTGGPSYLVLHKNEWNKLKQKAAPPEAPVKHENEYLKALTEQSQAWIKNWPDTVQGHVANLAKEKEKQRTKDVAAVKAFVAKKVRDSNTEAVKKARQRIFDQSCFGKKLLAAFRESKTLEERDVQVEYLKKLRIETAELEEEKAKQELQHGSFGLDKNDATGVRERRQKAIESAQINKEIHNKHIEDIAKTTKQQKMDDLEEARLMKELLEREKEAHVKVTLLEKQIMAEYGDEHKKIKAAQAERNAQYDKEIEECKREHDKFQCKIQQVLKQVQNKRLHNTNSKRIFEIIAEYQQKEKNRYDSFIDKQTKTIEVLNSKKEEKDKQSLKEKREKLQSMVETNKMLAETARHMQCPSNNKCFCDRQCVLPKSNKERMKKVKSEVETEVPQYDRLKNLLEKEKITHFGPCNKLTAALKRREQEPSPYTGAGAAHEQFAKEADDALRDCKYKIAGRKVVDEYRKYNGLDATTLPIPNYY